ncbi:penicillin acylase family protein [Bosea caraganae]|uniref:Penicillin acylase family protein n=1 Tax=Bosea caraganae TaxID=2763117 RepID=A0A370L8X1_9HYPH|nr:penicillin acylase family protein [Bosea caraganae]RDJ26819.1 penicillin acylase family protein [Bosea caraganae]RDJ30705.1 penicillin acylase family protein [Bosea caraganae]
MPAATIPTEILALAGLDAPAEILIDRWGVPHIYGATQHDAFFLQGLAVARDRLWQIDIWRKRGLGLLAADYGEAFAEADRAARLMLYRGDMDAEWACYGPNARAAAEAFVAGINARIAILEAELDRLPVEFLRTGTRPSRWAAEDCVRIRSHGPLFNFGRELARADVVERFGLKAEAARKRLEPDWTLIAPEGIATEPIPSEVRTIFALATDQPAFDAANIAAPETVGGSNNWAVSAARTETGRPILASDPHRLLMLPSLRYVSHLSAPGLDVIGAGEPGVPGVALGHNRTSAFCFTIHPADQADLYVYELHPDDSTRYRYGDGWEGMQTVSETIAIAGGDDRPVELCWTRHGPVLHIDQERRRAYALRSIWSEPGSAPYLSALRYQAAESWDDFVAARSHWLTPPVNHVFANIHGEIGWIMSGFVPVRPNWDGLHPVAGDGSHEWAGFMKPEAHPRIYNPEAGWVATANEMNLPEGFDVAAHKVGFDWCDSSRYRVIAEELRQEKQHGLADSRRLQTSFVSDPARRLVALLGGLSFSEAVVEQARALLAGWNGELGRASAPALLFEIWFRNHLIEAVSEHLAPGAFAHFDANDIAAYDTLQLVDLLVVPDERLDQPARDALLARTLVAAWGEAMNRAGDDPTKWQWGDLHHAKFVHPLAALLGDETLNTRRMAMGGSGLTPNAADYRPDDFGMTVGASFRMVLDIGEWDNCVFVNAPGQSGDPQSRHYDDHLDAWSRQAYLPLLYSRAKVEAAAVLRIEVTPGM